MLFRILLLWAVLSTLLTPAGRIASGAPQAGDWTMAGANPERTSWTAEEVRGTLKPLWYKVFEPYIPQKVQIVAANGLLYISTTEGLYALDAQTGREKWAYPTSMPLGHSPTIHNGVAYVGGFDRKLHALDAITGRPRWVFEAGAGFDTNPLVVEGKVFAGNRDGYFYAIHAEGSRAGRLAWKYPTQGPIHFSAAYKAGVVYFASNDSRAYALNAGTGRLVWKSDKLPGAGFHSWWPVIYEDWVIFPGSNNYRVASEPGVGFLHLLERNELYPNHKSDPRGTYVGKPGKEPGDWASGTTTIDTSQPNQTRNGNTLAVTEYLEKKPWRRTYFVFNRLTGKEYTTDFDRDGKPEYAPILWFGAKGAGNRYPPIVGGDGVLYQTTNYMSDPGIAGGNVAGWKPGTPFISLITTGWNAVDEPLAYSAGGDLVYINKCCDRVAVTFDISTAGSDKNRKWKYFNYDLPELIPQYNEMTYVWTPYYKPYGGAYGGKNGSYGWHGDVNPPVAYAGNVYMHRSNAVIAFSNKTASPQKLSTLQSRPATAPASPSLAALAVDKTRVKAKLADEVKKIIAAGHLRPGYMSSGLFDQQAQFRCGEKLVDYWHYPGDILVTLLRAMPYLPPDLQAQTSRYLQAEFRSYPPYQYSHIGWKDGAARETFLLPPEVEADRLKYPAEEKGGRFKSWSIAPQSFYALWKYADRFGGAREIFDLSKEKLEPVPAEKVLSEMPHVHNAFIAGYMGYLELEKLAGYPATSEVQRELARLLELRVSSFSKDAPEIYFSEKQVDTCRALNVSRNFMYLTPELAGHLRDRALSKVTEAVAEYQRVAPLWFVSKAEVAFGEGVINHYYDYHSLFSAKAWILQEPAGDLVRYLDISSVPVGDLFYIDNLVSILAAGDR